MFCKTGNLTYGRNKHYLLVVICIFLIPKGFGQPADISDELIVSKFYSLIHKPLFWLSSEKNIKKANEWLIQLTSADRSGIILNKKQADLIRVALLSNNNLAGIFKEQRDRQLTSLILHFLRELQEGSVKFDYNRISINRDSVYINQLMNFKDEEPVSQIVSTLDCRDHDYRVLKKFLNDSLIPGDSLAYKKVIMAMNYCRFLNTFRSGEYVLANIPSAEAIYYRSDSLKIKMRTVVGKKESPTPRIASYFTTVVTFPLWNVPHSISVKEILPKVQKDIKYLEQFDYEVVDVKGNIVDESKLRWGKYNQNNFPYLFRQATGPGNSLGVVKFNLQSPFSIYLHSTNSPGAFARDRRFLSHGCVRLEKAFELAHTLLPNKIDINELQSGKKNAVPQTILINRKIPVYIIYNPVKVLNDKVILLPDPYGLIN